MGCQYKSLPNRPFDLQAWPWPWTGMVGTWVLHIASMAWTSDTSFMKILQLILEIWSGHDFERTDRQTDIHQGQKKYPLYTGGDNPFRRYEADTIFGRTNGWADRRTDRHTSRTKKYLLYTGGDIIVKSTLINFSCASLLKLNLIS